MNKNKIATVTSIAVAGSLILSLLPTISTNQTFAQAKNPTVLSLRIQIYFDERLFPVSDKVGTSQGKSLPLVVNGQLTCGAILVNGATVKIYIDRSDGHTVVIRNEITNGMGSYTFNDPGLDPGIYTIKADFAGNSECEPSSATRTLTVTVTG